MSTLLPVLRVELRWLRGYLALLPILVVLWVVVAHLLERDPVPWLILVVGFPMVRRVMGMTDEKELLFDLLPVTRRTVATAQGLAALLATLLLVGGLVVLVAIVAALGMGHLLMIDLSGEGLPKAFTFTGIMVLILGIMEHLALRFGVTRRLVLPVLALLAGVLALFWALSVLSSRLPATVTTWFAATAPWLSFTLGVVGCLALIPLNVRVRECEDH